MKVVLTIVIVILILRILARYNMQRVHDSIREQERLRQEQIYHQQQQHRQKQPDITINKKSSKDDGDYIDYEEVK